MNQKEKTHRTQDEGDWKNAESGGNSNRVLNLGQGTREKWGKRERGEKEREVGRSEWGKRKVEIQITRSATVRFSKMAEKREKERERERVREKGEGYTQIIHALKILGCLSVSLDFWFFRYVVPSSLGAKTFGHFLHFWTHFLVNTLFHFLFPFPFPFPYPSLNLWFLLILVGRHIYFKFGLSFSSWIG